MSWDKGFNFRGTSGFVTDGANETYVLLADTYPQTRNTVTFGWTGAPYSSEDGSASDDRRLAGQNTIDPGHTETFRVDLPSAGAYTVRLAMGHHTYGAGAPGMEIVIKDDTTALLTIGPHPTTAANYYDAADASYSAAAWPGSNTASGSLTFATTTMNVVVDGGPDYAAIAHLFVSQVSGGGGGTTQQVFYRRKR